MKETIKTIIADFHASPIEAVFVRDLELPIGSGKVISLIGPRRSGKSFLTCVQFIGASLSFAVLALPAFIKSFELHARRADLRAYGRGRRAE